MQIILPQGNYRELLTFKRATVIYDLTYYFANNYLSKGDRTIDQMIQAARSGKQNIAEGVAASSTNSETEIRLVNVAKASLQELLVDYEDYLRTRGLPRWSEKGAENRWVREFAKSHEESSAYLQIVKQRDDVVVANMAIVLLKLEDYLLHRQLKALETAFNQRGDLKGRLREASKEIQANRAERARQEALKYGKKCPVCGQLLVEGAMGTGADWMLAWECRGCGHKEKADARESLEISLERKRLFWRAKCMEPRTRR